MSPLRVRIVSSPFSVHWITSSQVIQIFSKAYECSWTHFVTGGNWEKFYFKQLEIQKLRIQNTSFLFSSCLLSFRRKLLFIWLSEVCSFSYARLWVDDLMIFLTVRITCLIPFFRIRGLTVSSCSHTKNSPVLKKKKKAEWYQDVCFSICPGN